MANDMISRGKLRVALNRENGIVIDGRRYIRADCVMNKLDMSPSLDAVEVVHGRWKRFEEISSNIGVSCSACGWKDYHHGRYKNNLYNYCPNCGAKMDLVEDADE